MIKRMIIALACVLISVPTALYASKRVKNKEEVREMRHESVKKKSKTRQERLKEHGIARTQVCKQRSEGAAEQATVPKKAKAKKSAARNTKQIKQKPAKQKSVKKPKAQQSKVVSKERAQQRQAEKKKKRVKKVTMVRTQKFENYKENSLLAWADDSLHWAVPVTVHGSFSDRSFNDDGSSCSLADLVFGQNISVQDIFLLSRLSREAKVSVAQSNFPGVFQRPADVPAVAPNIFGVYGSDQFLGLLAPMQIKIGAERRELGADISSMYRLWLGKSHRFNLTTGLTLPLKSVTHIMDISFLNAKLPIQPGGNIVTGSTANVSTNPIAQFFNCFGSLEDFVIRGIFGEIKGICFDARQNRIGVGDLNLFTFVDMAGYINDALYTDRINSAQLGVAFILPTGNKDNGTRVWEPILGNGGAFQVDLFGQLMVRGSVKYINPSLRVVGSFSVPYTNNHVRVPVVVTNDAITASANISGLRTFGCTMEGSSFVQPFQEVDSTIPMFADNRVAARIHYGSQVIVGVGNIMYDLFNTSTRLELFYEFLAKQQDSVEVKCASADGLLFNACELTNRTERRAHTISWSLTYEFASGVELNVGSLNIFAGKNVPRYRDVFGGVMFAF